MTLNRLSALVALLLGYAGLRLAPAYPPPATGLLATLLVALFVALTSAAASGFGRRATSPWRAWAGLLAIGLFSSLLVFTLLRDAVLLAAMLVGRQALLSEPTAWAVPFAALAASAWGLVNARRRPAVRDVDVPIAGLPPALAGYTFVQISDLHVGPTIRRAFVQRVVDDVNALSPDAVVLTGDLVDGSVDELAAHVAPLAGLKAPDGIYAVTGNHEYYAGAAAWIDAYRRLGFDVLTNRHVVLERGGAAFVLAGVADWSAHHFDASHRSDPAAALRGAPPDAHPRVLLAHQPRSADAADAAGYDLQLSGHTHGGQFFPWNLFVPLQQPYTAGLHRHGGRLWVYTSRGTGYWGPPKRLGAPSEITRIRLVPA